MGILLSAGILAQLVLFIETGGALHASGLYLLCTYVWLRRSSRQGNDVGETEKYKSLVLKRSK